VSRVNKEYFMGNESGGKYILETLVVGPLGVNCYILADSNTKEACIIDPGADPDLIRSKISERGVKVKFIVNTHGHGDHIGANADFKVPVYIHAKDKASLTDPKENLSGMFFYNVISPAASRLLTDEDDVAVGALRLKVIHTPGHTPGSITLVMDNIAFTGDTLFAGSVGRIDLPGGSGGDMARSIKKLKKMIGDDVTIYPGHGPSSTMGLEKQTNPFLM